MTADWLSYNEALVKRDELLPDFNLLHTGGEELEEMNRSKEGVRYRCPDSFPDSRGSSAPSSGYPTDSCKASPGP